LIWFLFFLIISGNIIESLDKLQQQLKLEEAVDEQLAAAAACKDADAIDSELFLSTKEVRILCVCLIVVFDIYLHRPAANL
jgi:hypothetical protein